MTRKVRPWRLCGVCVVLGLLMSLGGFAGALSSIRLSAPKSGAVLKGKAIVQTVVNVSDVSFVILGVDKQRVHATNASPYGFVLDTTEIADGAHTLFVEAYGRGGLLARSADVRVQVRNGIPKPVAAPVNTESQVKAPKTTPSKPVVASAPALKIAVNPLPKPAPQIVASTAMTSLSAAPAPGRERYPMAVSAEPKMTPQAVSLPTARFTPSAIAAETRIAAPALAAVGEATTIEITRPALMVGDSLLESEGLLQEANGSLSAGFRKVMTATGWWVAWMPSRQAGLATARGHRVEVTLGKDRVIVDGREFPLGRRVSMKDNRLVVALRPLCQATGISITWDEKTRTARLVAPNMQTAKVSTR